MFVVKGSKTDAAKGLRTIDDVVGSRLGIAHPVKNGSDAFILYFAKVAFWYRVGGERVRYTRKKN